MGAFFDGEIRKKCRLHIPKIHRDAVLGNAEECLITYLIANGVDALVLYKEKTFLKRFRNLLFPKEWSEKIDHDRTLAYSSTQPASIEDNGRIILRPLSLADFYGIQDISVRNIKSIDSIVGPVKGENRGDFLVLVKPEDFDKYRSVNPQ
jgi:DNA-binding transcriptional regulator/RsmH inhibitor MraZ